MADTTTVDSVHSSTSASGIAWHTLTAADALTTLDSNALGLSASEAARRLAQFGPNRLSPPAPVSALSILAAQFRGVVMLLLVSAAMVSFALGERVDAAAIGIVIAINAALGFSIELRARRAMEGLLQLGATRAAVVRDGRLSLVDAALVVSGDVIELAAGQTVPADARVLSETDLRTNEAARRVNRSRWARRRRVPSARTLPWPIAPT